MKPLLDSEMLSTANSLMKYSPESWMKSSMDINTGSVHPSKSLDPKGTWPCRQTGLFLNMSTTSLLTAHLTRDQLFKAALLIALEPSIGWRLALRTSKNTCVARAPLPNGLIPITSRTQTWSTGQTILPAQIYPDSLDLSVVATTISRDGLKFTRQQTSSTPTVLPATMKLGREVLVLATRSKQWLVLLNFLVLLKTFSLLRLKTVTVSTWSNST